MTMTWADDVTEEARDATQKFFSEVPRHSADEALMLAYAYGFMEAHDQLRREKVLSRYAASVQKLSNSLRGQDA